MADPREVLEKLDAFLGEQTTGSGVSAADVLAKVDSFIGQGYQGPMRAEGSSLALAPGTTAEDAQRIPRGMVYDPQTGGYADTAAMADRTVERNPVAPFAANVGAGIPFAGEYFDEAVGQLGALSGRSPDIGAEYVREVQDRASPGGELAARLTGGAVGVAGGVGAGSFIASKFPAFASWVGGLIPQGLTGKAITGGIAGGVVGGLEGAVSGAGAGDDQNRLASAGQYAGVGALAGLGLGAAAPVLGAGAGAVYNALRNNFARVSSRIPGLSPQASAIVRDAVEADALVGSPRANIRRAGPDAMPADFGPATKDLLDTSVSMSSAGRSVASEAVEGRAARGMARLNNAFDEVMGGAEGIRALREAVDAATQPGVRAAYRDAYGSVIDYSTAEGRRLEGIVSRIPERIYRKAIARAQERMDWEGIPYQFLAEVGEGGARVSRIDSVIELDYLKRGLDEIIDDGTDAITGKMSSEAQLASRMKVSLRDALADAVPAYRTALDEASDAFSLNRAMDLGQDLLRDSTTRETVRNWVSSATPVERRALAAGLRSSIDETVANVKRSVTTGELEIAQARKVLRELSSGASRSKIVAVFGPSDSRTIFRAINEATASLDLKASVAKNSMTAPRTRRDRMVRDAQAYSPSQIGRDIGSGEILQAPRKVAQIASANTPIDQNARTERLYLEIAEYLTGRRGEEALRAAEEMISAAQAAPVQSGAAMAIRSGTTAAVPAAGYPLLTQSQRTGPR